MKCTVSAFAGSDENARGRVETSYHAYAPTTGQLDMEAQTVDGPLSSHRRPLDQFNRNKRDSRSAGWGRGGIMRLAWAASTPLAIRYAFPAQLGAMTRGVPTSYAAAPLNKLINPDGYPPPVWPHAEGSVRGFAFTPLHKNVPKAALEDGRLYELLALVDALRDGRTRERELAGRELTERLSTSFDAASDREAPST